MAQGRILFGSLQCFLIKETVLYTIKDLSLSKGGTKTMKSYHQEKKTLHACTLFWSGGCGCGWQGHKCIDGSSQEPAGKIIMIRIWSQEA